MNDKPVILVVDDQPKNIDLLDAYLVPQGYDIVTAATGEDALGKLSGRHIDLMLLDVMMPGIDGFEVIRRVRQDPAHRLLPIILITSLRETDDRVKGIDAGCDDFISKPVDKLELAARVRSLLKVKAYNDLLSHYRQELEAEVAGRTMELADVNAGLEKKVAERTADLNRSLGIQSGLNAQLMKTTDALEKETQKIQAMNEALSKKSMELEHEKDQLRQRNEIMENDLDMARKIQKRFIPDQSPAPYISFQYKPMEKVGGDFFDFIRFTTNDWIGIFISDVSGHGVPAAFITAMIKSSLLQISPSISSPSSVLDILNEILIHQSTGNFITSFYGKYHPGTREFIYSNAGHNPPYIIQNNKIEYLKIRNKALPLALRNNRALKDLKKGYINETVVLEKGSKLILYTDGFTEAVNIKHQEDNQGKDFESERLPSSFRTHFHKPAGLFLEGIYQDLVDFRGCDDFEDDVCVICVDAE